LDALQPAARPAAVADSPLQAGAAARQAKNGLQHLALNQGVQKKRRLWSKAGQQVLRELPLAPWASRRREDLLKVMVLLDQQIESLDAAVKEAAEKDANARLLMSQPGVGPVTSLAFVLTMETFPVFSGVSR